MKLYTCFFVHRGFQEDVNLWAEDKDELVKKAFNIMNNSEDDIIAFFFWNYDVQKPFMWYIKGQGWMNCSDVEEWWSVWLQ